MVIYGPFFRGLVALKSLICLVIKSNNSVLQFWVTGRNFLFVTGENNNISQVYMVTNNRNKRPIRLEMLCVNTSQLGDSDPIQYVRKEKPFQEK